MSRGDVRELAFLAERGGFAGGARDGGGVLQPELVGFLKERRGIAKFTGVATVDGEVVCTAELMCAKREV